MRHAVSHGVGHAVTHSVSHGVGHAVSHWVPSRPVPTRTTVSYIDRYALTRRTPPEPHSDRDTERARSRYPQEQEQ